MSHDETLTRIESAITQLVAATNRNTLAIADLEEQTTLICRNNEPSGATYGKPRAR